MTFLDTNVLVAAALPTHEHHAACNARLGKVRSTGAACAAHSLAETYATLTHVNRYGIPPAQAMLFVKEISSFLTIVSLPAEDYAWTLHQAAGLGLRGAIVYDALLVACARKINAKWIYTNNVKHFQQVAPDLAARIRLP